MACKKKLTQSTRKSVIYAPTRKYHLVDIGRNHPSLGRYYVPDFMAQIFLSGKNPVNILKQRNSRQVPYDLKVSILERDNFTCGDCRLNYINDPDCLEIHHIVRRTHGGTNARANLIIMCANCHKSYHGWIERREREKLNKAQLKKNLRKT